MYKRIKNLLANRLATGASILTITTFLSYLTGLLRDRIFSRTFGAGHELDLYNTSFIVPDLLLNILVSSALSAAFIPIFTDLSARGAREKANELANTVLHGAILVIFLAAVVASIFMPWLSSKIAPGFTDGEQQTLISLSRLMLISPVIIALSSGLGAMLVSFKKFLPYGLSPIFYNFGIIGGALTAPWLGIHGLVLGTLVGALLHLLPRLVSMRYTTYRYAKQWRFKDAHFLQVIKLMIPKMIGHPVEQLQFFNFTRLATFLAAGSVTAVSFARNFQSVPVSLFGIAFSVAIFPILAETASNGEHQKFLQHFWKTLRNILIFTVPSALALYFLSDLPIRIFLGGGKFSDENIFRTAQVLSVFALSIPTESLIHLLARSFYALKNTIVPVILSVVGLVISVYFASSQIDTLGLTAIPYGFFLGSSAEVVLLGFFLWRRLNKLKLQPQSSPSSL